jgi:uncharacterized protein
MSEQQNVQLVQEFYSAFKQGNIAGADDVAWFISGPTNIISLPGQRQGLEQVAQFMARLAETQDAEQSELREFVVQGDKVVALGHYRWFIKSTGHSSESDWVHAFTIHEGKSRILRNIWTLMRGQPHIAVFNPLLAGK